MRRIGSGVTAMAARLPSAARRPGLTVTPALALVVLNFFMADVRDGLGPFFAVIMQGAGWDPGLIGTVMTLGGLSGVLATAPAGALVDTTRAKRGLLVAASLVIGGSCLLLLFDKSLPTVLASQVAIPVVGAVIPPAIAAITLGIVGPGGFARQLGRNEAANHGGNVVAAMLAALAVWAVGVGGILALQVVMTLGAIWAVRAIDPTAIDHRLARGATAPGEPGAGAATGLAALLRNRSLLLFALTMAAFHLANAAMLPMLGLRLSQDGSGAAAGMWMSASIVVAQATMVPVALLAARVADRVGYRPLVLAALIVLPLRGLIAATIDQPWALLPVQILDGLGAGLLGVATPGLAAVLLTGTGHFNAGLGAVMTLQGIGAALSNLLGFWIAQVAGYGTAFATLGLIALGAVPVFLLVRLPRVADGGKPERDLALGV